MLAPSVPLTPNPGDATAWSPPLFKVKLRLWFCAYNLRLINAGVLSIQLVEQQPVSACLSVHYAHWTTAGCAGETNEWLAK